MVKSRGVSKQDYSLLLLRFGLAFVFIFAAFSAFHRPDEWIGYIPHFTTSLVDAKVSLDIVSILQLVVAALLIVGYYVRYAALLGALLLLGIIVGNPHAWLTTFRDVGLLCMALALFLAADA